MTPLDIAPALWAHPEKQIAPALATQSPWAFLQTLAQLLKELGNTLDADYREIRPQVWVHRTAEIAPDAVILPPAVIAPHAVLRSAAYLRGSVYIAERALVGHCTEIKNSVLMQGAAAPHFNYVGDSILGAGAHLGAGVVLSNLRHDKAHVRVCWQTTVFDTDNRKLGALLGDKAEVGCNAVLNPGTVLSAGAVIHPLQSVTGFVAAKPKTPHT